MFTTTNVRWLFAETLVIVLGVLLAITIDDAWNAREERALEVHYLERLEQELHNDLRYIREGFTPGVDRKKASLEAALPVIRGMHPVPEEPLEFLANVARGGILSASRRLEFVSQATYLDLLSTGNMRLIRDPGVRAAVVNYYRDIENQISRIEGRNSGYVQFVHGALPAELRDDMSLADVRAMGLDFALARLTSDEFRAIANAEYNKTLMMHDMPFEQYILEMIERVTGYRQSLQR